MKLVSPVDTQRVKIVFNRSQIPNHITLDAVTMINRKRWVPQPHNKVQTESTPESHSIN